MSEMFDSIDPSQIPAGQDAAGYVDGRWKTFSALHGPHNLSIAVFPADDADAADDEPGDMTNAQAAQWVLRELGLGHWRPCIYTSVSNVAALLAALAAVGIARGQVRIWTAHYTYVSHRCTHACWGALAADFLADATQWTDRSGGRNLDESTIADDFFGDPPPPPFIPRKKAHMFVAAQKPVQPGTPAYVIFDNGTKLHLPDPNDFQAWLGACGQTAPVPLASDSLNAIPDIA